MPRQVDHDERRRAVAEIATDLIARGGLDALTVREVARAANYSTAIVSHYFTAKRDLLSYIYRAAVDRAAARINRVLAADPCDLHGVIDAILPINAVQIRDWQVWFAFWGMAVADPEFGDEQRRMVLNAQRIFREIFIARQRARLLERDADCELLARLCVTLLDGIAIQAVFDPDDWPPHRQRAVITTALGGMAELR